MENNFLAFIPARGNSVRVKNKNLKLFKGKPLIYWSLKNVLRSKYIEKAIISSDSQKILNYCKKISKKKFILSKRPKYLSSNNSLIKDTIIYEIKKFNLKKFKFIVLLQPTSPLRSTKLLDQTLKKVINKNLNSLVTVHDINKTLVVKKKLNKLCFIKKKRNFFIDGDIYIFNNENFLKNKKIITKDCFYFSSNGRYSDIDYLEEFYQKKL